MDDDVDNDGEIDGDDPDPTNPDTDGDGILDGEDPDADGDGVDDEDKDTWHSRRSRFRVGHCDDSVEENAALPQKTPKPQWFSGRID